jgi:hypothetical protein
MRKYLEFSGDIALILLLIGIITIAALGVFSLSPSVAEDFGYEKTEKVLGQSEEKYPLIFEDISASDSIIEIRNTSAHPFKHKVKLNPSSQRAWRVPIIKVTNPKETSEIFSITSNIPENYEEFIKLKIGSGQELIDLDSELEVRVDPKSDASLDLVLITPVSISFPIEFEIVYK